MTNRQIKKVIFFGLLAICLWAAANLYARGYRMAAVAVIVINSIEALWLWHRYFARRSVR